MSASPPETSEEPRKPEEKISFKFCADCANMLYPKENKESSELMFACRTCQYSEKATSSCVYRHTLDTSATETAGVTTDIGSDPTVGVPGFCTVCSLPIRCSFCEDMVTHGRIWEVEFDGSSDEDYGEGYNHHEKDAGFGYNGVVELDDDDDHGQSQGAVKGKQGMRAGSDGREGVVNGVARFKLNHGVKAGHR